MDTSGSSKSNRVPVAIEDEMRQSFMDYAMSVIIARALPDARDGLKPVHRRALYAMYDLNNDWNRPYKKSATVVGDVLVQTSAHGLTRAARVDAGGDDGGDGVVTLGWQEPQRRVAPGQSVVLYDATDTYVLGGGIALAA